MSEILKEIYDNYFLEFTRKYPTQEHRRQAAIALAEDRPYDDENYESRKFLAAQWGENEDVLRARAHQVYHLGRTVRDKEHFPVAIMRKGTVAEVFAEGPVENEISFDFGRAVGGTLLHGFKPTERGAGTHQELIFATRMLVADARRFSLDIVGEPEEVVMKAEPQVTTLFAGRSPLKSLQAYQSEGRFVAYEMLWGSEAATLVERLHEKAAITEVY